jgi:branched-chain amino acid:cation transporter, LIVCS family
LFFFLALHPSKFVDRFGKIVTPFLLVILATIIIVAIVKPFNAPETPLNEYAAYPFFKGITEGYLTMDTIVSIVFATIIINAIRNRGILQKKSIQHIIWKFGAIAVLCLGFVYLGLGYLGATSSNFSFTSGASILSGVSQEYFGVYGNVILGIAILLACIPTGAGLLSSCAFYFNKKIPRVSYKRFLTLFVLFSGVVANVGLEKLIGFLFQFLSFIYPVVIVLILLTFLDKLFKGDKFVYRGFCNLYNDCKFK